MAKKAPAHRNLEFTIGYNEAKNFLVTNEDARGIDAWKIDFAKLMGANASIFSGMKSVALTSSGGATFTIDKGVVKYDAGTGFDYLAEGQTAIDTVSYTANLLGGLSATLNLKFLVQGRNDAPKAAEDSFSFTEDLPLHGASVLSNDTNVDKGAVLTASLVSDVKHGALDFLSDGTFVYMPEKDYAGVDTFTYRAFDGKAYSDEVTVTLNGVDVPEPDIKVAVIGTNSSSAGQAAMQLNDDTYFNFNAVRFAPSDFSTAEAWREALSGFKAVVIGGSGWVLDDRAEFGASGIISALHSLADEGMGIVSTSMFDHTFLGDEGMQADADAISPIRHVDDGFSWAAPSYSVQRNEFSHPITDGLVQYWNPTSFWETAQALDPNAVALATASNISDAWGIGTDIAVAISTTGSGANLAYLGGLYLADPNNYNLGGLRAEWGDRLFENTIAWAAGSGLMA